MSYQRHQLIKAIREGADEDLIAEMIYEINYNRRNDERDFHDEDD